LQTESGLLLVRGKKFFSREKSYRSVDRRRANEKGRNHIIRML
jgi:hypothetical protein